ncbi:MAG: T9SS type A sorting domain-containing protein [Muribaculaceae bacterium]
MTDIEMTGAYKIWSGWGGRPENVNGDNSGSYWSSHVNWGFNKWVSGQSTPINTEEWYGMNGAGFDIKDGGAFNYVDNSAGGDFNFDGTRLFSKVQLWYALDDNNPNKGRDDSWVITYLAVANPYISIRRSAKTEVTGDYEMRNLPTDGRTVKSYRIYLIKEGEDGADGAKTLVESKPDGSYDPATLKGTVVSDNLPSGRYKYRFEASYNQGGTVTYPDQAWETPWVRIYGMIQPVITRAEQVTVVEGNELDGKKTFYSFDIAVEAHAPSTTTDNGSELSDLIKSYKVTFPSITGYDFAASIEAKNSDGTEATTSVSGNTMTVTPDKGNNNAMPSLTFKNVIPGDHKFTVDMLAEDGDTEWPADNVTSASETVEMVVPSVKLDNMRASLNQVAADADMTHIALEERMNVRHGHVREHDTEGSSWEKEGKTGKQNNGGYGAHLSRYNRIDAYGDLSTLLVTDGVLTDWDVNIEVVLQDAGAGLDEKYHYTPDASSTINKTANELVISYLPVAMQDKPIADELTIYTDNATAKAQTYHAPAKTIVNYVVTTTYKRKTVTSDVVTATKDESTFTVYNPEKPNDSNVQFGAVTGSFDKPHGIQLEGHSWQKWYNAFNVLDLETGNANGNFAVGFFFTNGTELPVYEPTDPQHKIYPGGHVLDCSINRHNGYTERFYNVFTDAPSATKHFGEMAVDATGYGVDEHGGGGYKSLPLHLGCVYKFDNVTDKPLLKEDFSSFAKLEGVLITTHPIVVKPDGNGVRPTVSLMTSDSKTIPFVAAAKNAKAASRALLAIETPSHVEKGFDGATTDLDEVLGDFNTAFRVFPNPAVDIVTVEASAEIGNVEVVASNGATALKAEIRDTKGQLDVSALPAGLYLLRTDAGTTRLIVK